MFILEQRTQGLNIQLGKSSNTVGRVLIASISLYQHRVDRKSLKITH